MCIGPELIAGFQAVGLLVGAAGAATSYVATQQQSAASKDAEAARKASMELESARQRREIIRRAQLAQATALTRTTAQTGSSATAGSSALPGAMYQEAASQNKGLGLLGAQTDLGEAVFDANARGAQAAALKSTGQSFSSLGSAIMTSGKGASELGVSLFGNSDPWNTSVRRYE